APHRHLHPFPTRRSSDLTVVIGIQNSPGSTLMTLADMSVVTAEVRVDETDIVNVKLGETVDVTIDALPDKIFKGRVTEIGDQARSEEHTSELQSLRHLVC